MGRTAERLLAGNHPNFTVSFGVASSDQAPDFLGVVTLADEALLQAKSGGRDKIVVANALGSVQPEQFGATRPLWRAMSQQRPRSSRPGSEISAAPWWAGVLDRLDGSGER